MRQAEAAWWTRPARLQGGQPTCSTRRFLPCGTEAGLWTRGAAAHPCTMRRASGTLLGGGDTGGSHHASPGVPSAGRPAPARPAAQ